MSQEMENNIDKVDSLELSRGSDKWTLKRALACTMTDRELLDYYSSQKNQNVVIKSVLEHRDLKRLAAGQHKTIEKILNEFTKRERGYSSLRLALVRRYNFASQADKRRIVETLLSEYKQDRIMAYTMLKSNWDSYFTDKMVSLYNQYHDNECLIVFIKHYPITFLQDKFDAIAEYYGYPYACYCMGPDYVEKIDKHKMHPDDWLRLMATFKQKVSEAEAEAILYYYAADNLNQSVWRGVNNRDEEYSLLKIQRVRDVIRYMGYLGMADAILRFGKICEKVDAIAAQTGSVRDSNGEIDEKAAQAFFNKIGEILPKIKVEEDWHNDIKKWIEKGQPVYDYADAERWYFVKLSDPAQNQVDSEYKPADDLPF